MADNPSTIYTRNDIADARDEITQDEKFITNLQEEIKNLEKELLQREKQKVEDKRKDSARIDLEKELLQKEEEIKNLEENTTTAAEKIRGKIRQLASAIYNSNAEEFKKRIAEIKTALNKIIEEACCKNTSSFNSNGINLIINRFIEKLNSVQLVWVNEADIDNIIGIL